MGHSNKNNNTQGRPGNAGAEPIGKFARAALVALPVGLTAAALGLGALIPGQGESERRPPTLPPAETCPAQMKRTAKEIFTGKLERYSPEMRPCYLLDDPWLGNPERLADSNVGMVVLHGIRNREELGKAAENAVESINSYWEKADNGYNCFRAKSYSVIALGEEGAYAVVLEVEALPSRSPIHPAE